MKILFLMLMAANASASSELTGKIIRRQGVDYLTAAPGKAVAEYAIEWQSSSAHPHICYADLDSLCPSYAVYFARQASSPHGAVLVDAVAILAP